MIEQEKLRSGLESERTKELMNLWFRLRVHSNDNNHRNESIVSDNFGLFKWPCAPFFEILWRWFLFHAFCSLAAAALAFCLQRNPRRHWLFFSFIFLGEGGLALLRIENLEQPYIYVLDFNCVTCLVWLINISRLERFKWFIIYHFLVYIIFC